MFENKRNVSFRITVGERFHRNAIRLHLVHNASCLSPKILHNHSPGYCSRPMLREIGNNGYAKFWEVNKVHCGIGENNELLFVMLPVDKIIKFRILC